MKFQGEKILFKHFLGWQGWQLEWNGLPCTDLVLGIVLFCCLFQGQWEDENSYIKRMGRYQTNVKINGELTMNLIHVDFILDM